MKWISTEDKLPKCNEMVFVLVSSYMMPNSSLLLPARAVYLCGSQTWDIHDDFFGTKGTYLTNEVVKYWQPIDAPEIKPRNL